jgi:hypothetical protein
MVKLLNVLLNLLPYFLAYLFLVLFGFFVVLVFQIDVLLLNQTIFLH